MEMETQTAGATMLEKHMAAVKKKFVSTIPDRIIEMDSLLQMLDTPASAEQVCREIHVRAHNIHGTASTLGFIRMGVLASQLENFIAKIIAAGLPNDLSFVSELLDNLLEEMELALDED
jgi:HPt (histidine-containing phosphotransfer) domain-containing protein